MAATKRREILRQSIVVGAVGLTGCTFSLDRPGNKDTDGDGVVDSKDYAPRDSEVQQKSDLQDDQTPTTPVPEQTVLFGSQGETIYQVRSDGTASVVVDGIATKGMAVAPDGSFWVTQQDVDRTEEHVRNVTRDGNVRSRFVPPDEGTRGIDVDGDGSVGTSGHLYLVGNFSDAVFELTQTGDVVAEYRTPTNEPVGLSVDPQGYVWLTNQQEDIVYRTTPSGSELVVNGQWAPDIASKSSVREAQTNPHTGGIAVDGDSIWVKDKSSFDIYRFTRDGEYVSNIDLSEFGTALRAIDAKS